jgi:integrase/recombinase XerD
MLGHASLESTEIYTKISVRRLQAVYEATHPAAKVSPLVAPHESGD